MKHLGISLLLVVSFLVNGGARDVDGQETQPMRATIDARDLSRKLIESKLVIPVEIQDSERPVALWYPKWVPGSHGPGGPVANVAGLQIHDSQGARLSWKRSPGEVYRLEVDVPAGEDELHISIRYLADQPTTTSFGHDCFGSNSIGVISPGCLLLYAEGADIDQQQIQLELLVPESWKVASALPGNSSEVMETSASYRPVTLRTLVDSPIMFGRYYRSFDLTERADICPPHTLHVFAEDAATANLNDGVLANYRKMVTQTAMLTGSHPFDRFDILLGVSSELPKNGLEHSRSTFNVLPPGSLRAPASLKGWDRLLVPHEYLHAWCGKYRRPAGMFTSNFHEAKDTELLWVYEGLTQYLGELVEARSGMMRPDEFRHRLFVELRSATHQQGRQWRTLADTAAASHILRGGSPRWGGLRRSQDYYMEGMLFWLEADAQIRRITQGHKSLDDFCHRFFKASRTNTLPKPFTRSEVVETLSAVAEFDWDGLISRRVESFQQQFDPAVASLLGYRWEMGSLKPSIPAGTFRRSGGVDLLDSLGMSVSSEGKVQRVLLGSPADQARFAPSMEIMAVGGKKWSGDRLEDAVRQSISRQPIDLMVTEGDRVREVQIQYYDGLQYWTLERDDDQPDLLDEILSARSS